MRVGAHLSIAQRLDLAVDRAVEIGANTLQIHGQSPRVWAKRKITHQEIKDFRDKARNFDVTPVFLHGIYLLNLATPNRELLVRSVDSLVHYLHLARDLKAQGVIFHIGSGKRTADHDPLSQIVRTVREILKQSQDCPDLILEQTVSQGDKIGDLGDLGWLLKEIDSSRVKVCLDTCHLFVDGYALGGEGLARTLEEARKHGVWERVVVVHVNEAKFGFNSKKDRHENLGEGKIGLAALKEFLSLPDINKLPMILEVPGFDNLGADARNLQILRSLLH